VESTFYASNSSPVCCGSKWQFGHDAGSTVREARSFYPSKNGNLSAMTSFRNMPTFGSSTIRRFATNASEMKKLAARDFEDLLQVWSMISGKKKN
jgi:hypothetical protein